MPPKNRRRQTPAQQPQRIKLGKLLNPNHSLVQLAHAINWAVFEEQFEPLYARKGRPGLSTRLLVGLHYLKHLTDISDETVVHEFVENPYWQYFCGLEYFEHELPCHPTSLVKWRNRVGPAGMERLLQETLDAARRAKALLRRRSAIEPIISHLKHDHRMDRNHLLETDGDRINAMLTGCGFNLRKLLRVFKQLLLNWILVLTRQQHVRRTTFSRCP